MGLVVVGVDGASGTVSLRRYLKWFTDMDAIPVGKPNLKRRERRAIHERDEVVGGHGDELEASCERRVARSEG